MGSNVRGGSGGVSVDAEKFFPISFMETQANLPSFFCSGLLVFWCWWKESFQNSQWETVNCSDHASFT